MFLGFRLLPSGVQQSGLSAPHETLHRFFIFVVVFFTPDALTEANLPFYPALHKLGHWVGITPEPSTWQARIQPSFNVCLTDTCAVILTLNKHGIQGCYTVTYIIFIYG